MGSASDTNYIVGLTNTGPTDKLEKLRILVENKNSQGTAYHKTSRLHQCETGNNQKSAKLVKKFLKRKQEVEELLRLTDKIKGYIKDHKEVLIQERKQVEKKIFEIQVQNNHKLRDTIQKKVLKSQLS